jgi:hypothetical protein
LWQKPYRPTRLSKKPLLEKSSQKSPHLGVKNRQNMGWNIKNKAVFVGFVPLCDGDFLKRYFFDSFNGLRY